jgi:anti-sigma B factor antagonist
MPKEANSVMEIEEQKHINQDGITVIVLKPKVRLDISTSWQLRLKLQECISQISCCVIVNLAQVIFIDSAGLAALVAGMTSIQQFKGRFCICNLLPEAKVVFEITMMDTLLEIFDTEEEALNNLLPAYL